MLYINLQFFGGRGSGGGKGGGGGRSGGGGGSAGTGKGSAANPVKSGEFNKLSSAEKSKVLNNMPEGTQVLVTNPYYGRYTFVKRADGWEQKYQGEKVYRGRLVKTDNYMSAKIKDIIGSDTDPMRKHRMDSIRYPKKK